MGFGPAFNNGKLQHVSCSQMNNFEACHFKWYAEKVLKKPSLQDWSWAQMGVAMHAILDQQVSAYLGQEPKEDDRLLPSATMEEAEKEVEWFDWEKYFLDHEIIDSEMEMVVPLGDDLPDLVGAADVVSRDAEGVLVVTDWKTGYGADKGVDIQTQAYTYMLGAIFDEEFVRFRRIYPRLPGEEKGWRKVEEYTVSRKDTERYEKRIKLLARQMKAVAEGELAPRTSPSDMCVYCDVAHSCPALKGEETSVGKMVERLKVLKAATKQIESALKKAAETEDLIIGNEVYGFTVSESWSVPRKIGAKKAGEMVYAEDPELFVANASLKISDEVAEKLKMMGIEVTQTGRRSFKLKNEKELKEAAKAAKKAETTSGGAK